MSTKAFSLIELMVVIAIIAAISAFAIPAYKTNVNKTNVAQMVDNLGTYKLALMDDYLANGSWSSSINSTTAGSTNTDSRFANATNFRYNFSGNKAWFGYKLSSGYGTGWVFMYLQANAGGIFESHCGAMSSDCTWGYCNSLPYYPSGCAETGMQTTYSISSV